MTSLFAKTLPKVIGDVFVATLGGLIGGSGATQDILITPTSISLPSIGSTATLSPVAVDGSGVPTGDRVYLYATDDTHVTVNPDTYVVTRVALGGTAVIYGTLIAPAVVISGDEPTLTNAANQHVILDTDLSGPDYSSATNVGRYPYSDADPFGLAVNRWLPINSPPVQGRPVDEARTQIITDTTKWLRHNYTGVGAGAVDWILYPPQPMTAVRPYRMTWTERWYPASDHLPQIKRVEFWWSTVNPDDSGRIQLATSPDGTGNMVWCVHDQVDTLNQGDLMSPFRHGVGDLVPGQEVVCSAMWKAHDRSPGTVDRLVSVVNPLPFTCDTFMQSQAGVIANGNRVKLRNSAGSADVSTAEFIVSNFDGDKRATLTRAADITGSTVSYSGGISFQVENNIVYKGVFSVSQAGHLTNGDILSMNNGQGNMIPCRVAAFDGTYTCELPRNNTTIDNDVRDYGGLWFSRPSDQTGFVKHWVNHVKEIDISAAMVDVIPDGAIHKWCTKESLSSLVVGGCLSSIRFGEAQANASGPWTYDVGRRISLWWES